MPPRRLVSVGERYTGAWKNMDSDPHGPATASPITKTGTTRQRMPLGRTRNKLSYERRLRLWIMFSSLPTLLIVTSWCLHQQFTWPLLAIWLILTFGVWLFVTSFFFESMTRPLQTL